MKKTLIFISVVFLLLTVLQVANSFGLFETKIENETDLEVAKWHIFVNQYDLNGQDQTFYVDQITYTDRQGKQVDHFAPGVTGTFQIVIDPTDTEVSFQYQMKIDMSQNQYKQIQLDQIEGLNGIQLTEQDGVYSRVMTLNEIEKGIKDTIQVTFHWDFDDKNNDSDSMLGQTPDSKFTIPISIQFEQYTNQNKKRGDLMKSGTIYRIAKIVGNVLFAVLGIILLICLYSFISMKVLSHKYVNLFSYTCFQIGSNSMSPTITTNDLIIVHLNDNIKKGDIITYEDGDTFVTHRVMEVNDTGYITKGDANQSEDQAILKDQVVGKVVQILPNYGVWFKVITTPKIIILICITLLCFSLAFSYTGKKYLSRDDDFGIYYSGIKMKKENSDDR